MIEFGKGALFYGGLDGVPLACGDLTVEDIPVSPYEEPKINFLLSKRQIDKIECTVTAMDIDLLNQMTYIPKSDTFTLKYNKPIMIQARWHKRHRTNKKWQKRYGMTPDTVEVICIANTCNYNDSNGNFDIDANSMKYKLKPHQKRRGLKIEI